MQRDATRLWRLDPGSGDTVAGGKLGESGVSDAAVAGGYLWVATQTDRGVWKIDGRGVTAGKVETGALPWAVVPAAGSLWVSNANDGTVTRIDPETDRTTTIEVGHRALGLAVAGDRVWVSLGLSAEDALARIVGSRVLTAAVVGDPVDTTDPAAGANEESLALVQATGLRLMDYRVRPRRSRHGVPDAAVGPPVVSKDGLSYTFRVRSGFAFSPPSTEKITAETFRTSVDRAREQKTSYCGYVLSVIKNIRTRGDTITFTLQRATGDLAARVAHPCASAVPSGAPHVQDGVPQPLPSAGPYYPDTHVFGQQIVLLRNPNYGGSKPQKLDAIVLELGLSSDEAALAVEHGDADYVAGEDNTTGLLAPGGKLATTYGPTAGRAQRWFSSPRSATQFLGFNYAYGPLRDTRLRRAVSLALDRGALAGVWGGTPQATMIPPGVPGYVEPGRAVARASARPRPRAPRRSPSFADPHDPLRSAREHAHWPSWCGAISRASASVSRSAPTLRT